MLVVLVFNFRLNFKLKLPVNKFKYLSLGGLLLGSLIGCQASLISIKEISANKIGKTVLLTGKVVHVAPLIDNTAYQIKDNTGTIWVATSQTPPKIGQLINIKGKIKYQSLPFGKSELGDFYIVELEQLESSSNKIKPNKENVEQP